MTQNIFADSSFDVQLVSYENLQFAQDILNHNNVYHTTIVYTQPNGLAERCLNAQPPSVEGSRVFKKFLLFSQNNQHVAVVDIFAGFPNYKTASIALFMVHDAWHRKGIAKSILTHTLPALLREYHPAVETISISLTDNNIPALRCLVKCGFDRTNTWAKLDANGRPITAVTFKAAVNSLLSNSADK